MKKLLRVAVLSDAWYPLWGGGQVHTLTLAQYLAKEQAVESDIFTMNLGNTDKSPPPHAGLDAVQVHPVGPGTSFQLWHRLQWVPRVITAVRKRHRQQPYDLIHAHSNMPGIPAKLLSLMLGIPVVYTVHGANFLEQSPRSLFAWLEWILFTRIRYSQEISVAHSFLQYPNRNTVAVIPNGVTIPIPPSPPHRSPKAGRKILFVGRLEPVKGLDTLLEATKLIRHDLEVTSTQVHIVGKGTLGPWLDQSIQKFNSQNLVILRGEIPHDLMSAEYQSADLVVIPSYSEGLPLVLLEAWAAQVPVVASSVGEIPRLVKPGINGYLVPPHDPQALAEAIRVAFHNPSLPKLGRTGYQMVRADYAWDTIARQTRKLYDRTVEAYAKS